MAVRMMSGDSWKPLLLTCVWSLLLSAYPAWSATLTLSFVDTDGHRVQVSKAELLLVAWAETERIELETSPGGLTLLLEPDWLRSRWSRFDDQEAVYLYLQSPPLAAIRSHRFRWPVISGYGVPTVIAFPGGRQAVVKDIDVSMTLAFRPAGVRSVRIVDPRGMPLRDVAVGVSMFWSDYNRCVHMTGSEWLGNGVTNAEGLIEVPDGDFEYVLSLGRFTHEFVEGDRRVPWRLRTHLTEATTEVRAREFAVETLEMRVLRGDEPAASVHLRGYLASCPCGACDGPLGTADETGRIRVDDYRPDQFDRIWLVDDGETVWESRSTWWPDVLEVRFPASTGGAQVRPVP